MSLNTPEKRAGEGSPEKMPEFITPEVMAAMERAVERAVEEHLRLGYPVVYSRDGRLVREYPDGSIHPVEPRPNGKNGAEPAPPVE